MGKTLSFALLAVSVFAQIAAAQTPQAPNIISLPLLVAEGYSFTLDRDGAFLTTPAGRTTRLDVTAEVT